MFNPRKHKLKDIPGKLPTVYSRNTNSPGYLRRTQLNIEICENPNHSKLNHIRASFKTESHQSRRRKPLFLAQPSWGESSRARVVKVAHHTHKHEHVYHFPRVGGWENFSSVGPCTTARATKLLQIHNDPMPTLEIRASHFRANKQLFQILLDSR